MRVPALDIKLQLKPLRSEIIDAVTEVIDSTQFIMGPKINQIEEAIAEYLDVKHAVGVSSGTDALLLSLMGLDIGQNDIVITTPYSFFATAGVVARLNARVMLADIDPDTYNLDPDKVTELLSGMSESERKKVKAILPVHLYGQSADMAPLMKTAEKYGIAVIEDAAQAIGASYPLENKNIKAGTIGLAGCFSFFPSKNLGGFGDGGMVATNHDEFVDKLRILRTHGAKPKYYHSLIGGNFRLDPIQAAVLNVKLPHLDGWHAGRQKNAAYYDANINIQQVKCPVIAYQREYHIYNQYVIFAEDRDNLEKYLVEKEIGCNIYYPVPFHTQPCFKDLSYKKGDFPVSEVAAEHTLALPIFPELIKDQLDFVINSIRDFYNA
ncbi:DegT/DnrJ/EryC1/StrS family aminotransferase [bacterium]|nr:DegT/DnrJ/EryC1/StrS family aminotransferase [bacterium]